MHYGVNAGFISAKNLAKRQFTDSLELDSTVTSETTNHGCLDRRSVIGLIRSADPEFQTKIKTENRQWIHITQTCGKYTNKLNMPNTTTTMNL